MRRRVGSHRGELAAFDEPRFLDAEGALSRAPAREQLRGFALVGRALVAVAIVALAPTATGETDATTIGWLIAALWLPVTGLVDFVERRRGTTAAVRAFSLFWDVALFAAVDVALDVPGVAGVGYLLVAAFHAYTGGRRLGLAALLLTSVAAIGAPFASDNEVHALRVVVEVVGIGLVTWLMADASTRHDTSQVGLARAEGKASAVLAGIADAVVVMDRRGRVEELNPAASATVGAGTETVRGRPCAQVLGLHSGLRPLDCTAGCGLLEDHESGTSVEVWRIDATGRRQPLLASAAAVVDPDGSTVEVVHSLRDITALKAADEAKTMFLATASHELKTPLTVIRGFAQLLHRSQDMTDDQYRSAVHAIELRAQELAGIVDRLLMSSRIDAGKIDLGGSLLDLQPLVTIRAEAFAAANSRPVEVFAPDPIPPVYGVEDGLLTVLDHLLDNAFKYSPKGGPITVTMGATGEEVVTLSVADRGIGMTPDQARHCFDRFWQAEGSDARRFGGTGIGLYIVKSLVDAMGGSITVTSKPGRGTRFDITLRTTPPRQPSEPRDGGDEGQSSMIREYMRQMGVPLSGGRT